MSRNLERVIGSVLAVLLVVVFFIVGRSGANTTIDNAQATAAALQNTVSELLDAIAEADSDSDELVLELGTAQAELSAASTLVAELQFTPTNPPATSTPRATATLAPTATPEFCYPSNLIEVVVIRDPRLNLWYEHSQNAKGRPIMYIYEDDNGNRVQYAVGTTFFTYDELTIADGMDTFLEVFGPLGNGLYAKETHIKLFDAEPDLFYCD